MELHPFTPKYLPAAVDLFEENFSRLRQHVPALPATLEDKERVASNLGWLMKILPGVVAVDEGRLVGYMTAMIVDNFRDAGHRAAYVPEWGHAAEAASQAQVYRQMYRYASTQWALEACQVHAITLLADDEQALQTWFWNGFGIAVVDALRPMEPLEQVPPTQLTIRQAEVADAETLAALDIEHRRYYTKPPVFMALRVSETTEGFQQFLGRPGNSVWMAIDGDVAVGFLRLNGYECDGAEAMDADETVMITGAFLEEAYRRRGASTAMLDAALRHHAQLGKTVCAVDFESFNPDATNFWLRYFQPVCLSLMRTPEVVET